MGRLLGAPGPDAGVDCEPTEADDMAADPMSAAIKELSRFAEDLSIPELARNTVARFVREKPGLLFELSVSPGEINNLDDCILSFSVSTVTDELLKAVRAQDWDSVVAVGRKYLG
jgi:hypothetical protein